MASIVGEIEICVPVDEAWRALRDFGAAGQLFAGVLVDCREAEGERRVTFANGLVVHERLIARDDDRRRLAYTVLDGPFSHHHGSMQVEPAGAGTLFRWISDFLPDSAADQAGPLVEAGCQAIKRNLEAPPSRHAERSTAR
ncbi:SRPBCC family protein [Sphingosinicella terrae]|uniref:SRPBCC family protein n=1 Tax=Sphingosinicella terrae TaxID=2172047 RepID=UPI000E0DE2F3|nr:SRPBCC family protein [Sphingosinicella terrae]